MIRDWLVGRLRRLAGLPQVATSPAAPGQIPASWQRFRSYVSVHPTALIAPSAGLQIFNPPDPPRICLEIGEGSHIFSTFSILRPHATIRVGRNCQLGASQFIAAEQIVVGDDVLMAWSATIIDTDTHSPNWNERKDDHRRCYDDYLADPTNFIKTKSWTYVRSSPVEIGDRAWIGFNVTILKGVTIGQEVVVGAAAVVTRSVADRKIVAGNPAKVINEVAG